MSSRMDANDPEDAEYSYIDDVGYVDVIRGDSHHYEGLSGHRPKPIKRPIQITNAESAKPSTTCCRRPPCWGWAILVIGLVIVATLIALLVYFMTYGATPASTNGMTFADCEDAYAKGYHTSGVYMISPTSQRQMDVYCEQQLDNGGWTVIQRRINGHVSFDRKWAEYKEGFGTAAAEYWLGNENIHFLTSGRHGQKLKIEMTHPNTTRAFADYSMFSIDGEDEKYTLHVAGWKQSFPPEDALSLHNGQGFSTLDQDNDGYDDENCGLLVPGGWWFRDCHPSNLNGKFHGGTYWEGIIWSPFTNATESLLNVRMMIKKA